MRGRHGREITNNAEKELLGFLSTQQANVCNTWFRKKEIHRETWQHPKSKQWSCIDYVIMRESDRRMCSDITVKSGAECNTDNQFLRASVRMACRGLKKSTGMNEEKRYDVSRLVSCKGGDDMTTGRPLQQEYIEEVLERATSAWPKEGTVEERWEVIHSALLESADELLGYAKMQITRLVPGVSG